MNSFKGEMYFRNVFLCNFSMMPDWTVTMELYFKKTSIQKEKLYGNSTFFRKLMSVRKLTTLRIKDKNRSYYLVVGLAELNADSG